MIKKIHLENFQAHEDTIIEPAPSLTSITGQSDQGKTSIIRAVKKVRDNRPLGNRFIRNGEKASVVTVDNVALVVRGSKTTYVVDKALPLSALRGSVPDEVTERLNLGPENIQEQHDSIFLLNETPGKVAQKLASLAELDEAQDALAYIKELKRAAKSEEDALRINVAQNEQVVENLRDIEAVNEQYSKIERKWSRIEKLKAEHTNLYVTVKKAAEANLRLSETPDVQHLIQKVTDLQKTAAEISKIKSEATRLQSIIGKAEKAKRSIGPDPNELIQKFETLSQLKNQAKDLAAKIDYAEQCEDSLSKIKHSEKEAREKWEALSGTCPLCGGEL